MIEPVHTAEYSAITFGSAPTGATIGGIARGCRRLKGAGDAEGECDSEQRHDRGRLAECVEHQRAGGEHLRPNGDEGDHLAIEVVGQRSGDEHERGDRQELGQTHPAEIGLAARDVVGLLQQRRGLQSDATGENAVADEQAADRRRLPHLSSGHRLRGLLARWTRRRATLIGRATQGPMGSLATETRWMDATDQAALVRRGDVIGDRTARGRHRTHRVARSGAERRRSSAGSTRPATPRHICPTAHFTACRSC